MPYRYTGTKIHRRLTNEEHTVLLQPGFATLQNVQTVQEVHPGEIVPDLTAAELQAFPDLFELVEKQ